MRILVARYLGSAILLAVVSLGATGCSAVPDQMDAEAYIREGAKQWAESVASGDTLALERILADDFVGVDPQGNFYDKATMIENTRQAPKYFASNKIGKVTVRFFGSTAVAQGEESWVRRQGERGRFVWTDTWVRRNGKWQIVSAQDASVKDKQ